MALKTNRMRNRRVSFQRELDIIIEENPPTKEVVADGSFACDSSLSGPASAELLSAIAHSTMDASDSDVSGRSSRSSLSSSEFSAGPSRRRRKPKTSPLMEKLWASHSDMPLSKPSSKSRYVIKKVSLPTSPQSRKERQCQLAEF